MQRQLIAETLIKLNQLAIEKIRENKYRQAIAYFQQSLYLEEKLDLTAQMAQSFYNLATTYILLEDYPQAYKKIKFAKMLFQEAEFTEEFQKAVDLEQKLKTLI
ncbi:MAG: hypothetical protein ACQEQG_09625 [Bacillota bacterium]